MICRLCLMSFPDSRYGVTETVCPECLEVLAEARREAREIQDAEDLFRGDNDRWLKRQVERGGE